MRRPAKDAKTSGDEIALFAPLFTAHCSPFLIAPPPPWLTHVFGSQTGLKADAGASPLNEQNKANLDAAEALVNARLNPFSLDSVDNAVGNCVSLFLAAIPTLVGYASGETNILDPTYPTADKTVDIMNMLNTFL